MKAEDIDAVARVAGAAFGLDFSEQGTFELWWDRLAHPLRVDPEGSFVAERDGRVIGVGQALIRERLWLLSMLTVEPGVQSGGAGRALLERTLQARDGTDCGLIVSSNDPRAMRLYAQAGFAVLPTVQSEGAVDRAKLPAPDPRIKEGGVDDIEQLAAISREVRGAPHTSELRYALGREGRLLFIPERGFVVVLPNWCVWLLVARDEGVAQALLRAALAEVGDSDRSLVRWLTADQQWAIQVLVQAGLRLTAHGALCVQGHPGPLAPFIPSGPFA
jgi:predicted N-acetyltransferase YhbS